jgi:hypothetical protein
VSSQLFRRSAWYGVVAALIAAITVIGAISVPRYRRAQRFHEEVALIKAIHTVWVLQDRFLSDHGRYAQSFGELVAPSDMNFATKSGYQFTITPLPDGYTIKATPAHEGSGNTFCSDHTRVIVMNCRPDFPTDRYVDPPPPNDSKRANRS